MSLRIEWMVVQASINARTLNWLCMHVWKINPRRGKLRKTEWNTSNYNFCMSLDLIRQLLARLGGFPPAHPHCFAFIKVSSFQLCESE